MLPKPLYIVQYIDFAHVLTMITTNSDSRTFKDLLHQIPKLSRPYSVFKDFPGPGKIDIFSRTFKDFQGSVATLSFLRNTCEYPHKLYTARN